ncbi:MAG: AgmX/PglI C-terminal domain-containing protein [Deltaproteobacteria bacterium]|nr:AgmX/PglI C-terminal domain-containing protein [Deltaproteobacteria bacterium]
MSLIGTSEEQSAESSERGGMTPAIADQSECEPSVRSYPVQEVRFSIFENSTYVGKYHIAKEQISIGSSHHADVVLDHQGVASIHAFVHFEKGRVFLKNKYPNNGLSLNGRSVKFSELNHRDVIEIGPFSIKVILAASKSIETVNMREGMVEEPSESAGSGPSKATMADARYSLTLINKYDSKESRRDAAIRLAKLVSSDADRIEHFLKKSNGPLKKDLDVPAARRWQRVLDKAGFAYVIQLKNIDQYSVPLNRREVRKRHEDALLSDAGYVIDRRKSKKHLQDGQLSIPQYEDDEDDLWETPFLLKDMLADLTKEGEAKDGMPTQLMIIKTIGDSVADVRFLRKGEKYSIPKEKGHLRLVEDKGEDKAYVYFPSHFEGHVSLRGDRKTELDRYKTKDYLYRKRKELYRIPFPKSGLVTIYDESCEYRISQTRVLPSPNVAVHETPSTFTWRHWVSSVGSHLVLLLYILIYGYFHTGTTEKTEPVFVRVDSELIKQMELKKTPEMPKKEMQPPKPEPIPVAEKAAPPKKTPPKRVAHTSPNQNQRKEGRETPTTDQSPTKHPNAGGGFGEGNIKNRDINQTGILSLLGGKGPGNGRAAVVAVTNLDAVPVPGATEKNFSVGGIKGSLGDGKIAIATGEFIQTKESQQILRSAGASGDGTVAALERGDTGKKRVQAMVTAKLNQTVKIEGGMSREMVKRVIDQHLSEITYCYESALISNPTIMGRIAFEWKIMMSGKVGEVRILASSVNSHEVHECIKSAIKSWQFPKPVGTEVIVSYPFVFDLVAF